MTLPVSGPLTATMIRDEFSGPTPFVLSDYYRGGGLVPDSPPNAGIPTSGAISFSDFYGADGNVEVVTLTPTTITDIQLAQQCRAGLRLLINGTTEERLTLTSNQINAATDWVIPNAHTGTYHVRASSVSGDAPNDGDPLNTWLALTTTRVFGMETTATPGSGRAGDVLVEISDNGGSNIVASAVYEMGALNSP